MHTETIAYTNILHQQVWLFHLLDSPPAHLEEAWLFAAWALVAWPHRTMASA